MRLAMIIALSGACTFSTAVEPDNPTIDGPPSDAPADAEIDGSPNVDTDSDGVFDATDNCRLVANADQHDEDADQLGDPCDPCPQIDGASTDTDGDKIGDACDPHPNASGDVLVRFEPFTGNALPAGWTIGAGAAANFVVANDTLTIDATSGTQIMYLNTGSQNHAIDVGVQLPSVASGTTFFNALTDLKSDLSEYYACGVRIDTTLREFVSYNDPTFTAIATDPMPADAPMFPSNYRIVSVLEQTAQSCTIPKAQMPHAMAATTNPRNRTNAGVRVGNVTAQVRYIAVYRF